MPPSDTASEAGSAWTVDRDAFNSHEAGRASAIAEMQKRLQAALLSKQMDFVTKTLLDAIELEADELEEAMLEVQAYLDRKETKGAVVPRFITDTSLRPIGPRPVSNGSLCNWNGTLVQRRDNRFVLDGYSKRLNPDVVRKHIRRRAPQLAKPHGSSGEYEEAMRRAQMSQMQAEIDKLSLAKRRVKDLESLRQTSGSMAPPHLVDMWHKSRGAPPRSKHRAPKSEDDVDIYAPDAWLTPPPSPKASRPGTATNRTKSKPEPEPEPEPESEPEPAPQPRTVTNIVVDSNMQLHLPSKSPSTREAAAFCRQLSMDVDDMSPKAGAAKSMAPPSGGLSVTMEDEGEGFILGMSNLRGGAQRVLERGLGESHG
eukprot:COSAG02_NODE_495_length_21151_cov_31.954256_13_plen_370_part_00